MSFGNYLEAKSTTVLLLMVRLFYLAFLSFSPPSLSPSLSSLSSLLCLSSLLSPLSSLFSPLSSLLSPLLPSCSLSLSYHFLSPEPAKHNYVPRLFELSSTSGTFRPNEILCPSRSENKICAFPFLQEDLYTANQPGNHANNGLRGPSLSDWLQLKNS